MLKAHPWRIITVVLAGGLAVAFIVRFANAQTSSAPSRPVGTQPNGRWQVVNPTPEFMGKTMLIDTQTGRTWNVCTVNKRESWCAMHRYEEGETGPIDEKSPTGN